jgi:HTH-type transcriptional regulator / antitoxin HigA
MNAAEVFAPGEFLKDELEARGWTQAELGEIMGRPTRLINEIIAGKRGVTPETAVQLASALGTSPDLWMNLESQYQLSKVQSANTDVVARRAALYEKYPVTEMVRRGWAPASESIDVLEQNFAAFFGVRSIDVKPVFAHAAKKSLPEHEVSLTQLAWLFRAKSIAVSQALTSYNEAALRAALPRLKALLSAPEETRHVPKILAECGVRYVLVEALKGSKIDGACFWLRDDAPVIAMSLRFNRIDNFWFVLRHEIEHVLQRHGRDVEFILDQDVGMDDESARLEDEVVANAAAADFCVNRAELANFIARVKPFFSEERILLFAQRLQTHPGVVIGQLHKALDRHDILRRHLVKIAHFVTKTASSDGWGLVEHY